MCRDVKPLNLYLCPGSIVKLGDFGLALAKGLLQDEDISRSYEGTPAYLSPERLEQAHDVDDLWARYVASDVWAVGMTTLVLCRENIQDVTEFQQLVPYFRELGDSVSRPYGEGVLEGLQDDESMALQEFLHNALWINYSTRPTARQLLDTQFASFADYLPAPSARIQPLPQPNFVEMTGNVLSMSGAPVPNPSDLLTAGSYSSSDQDD